MKKSTRPHKSPQRKRIVAVLSRIESLQSSVEPTLEYLNEYTLDGNVRPEFLKKFVLAQEYLLFLNPHRSLARLARLLPFYHRLFVLAAQEYLTFHGHTEDEANEYPLELGQYDSVQQFTRFLGKWIYLSRYNTRRQNFHALVNYPPKGVKYQQKALVTVFDNFIYLKTLLGILEKDWNISKLLNDMLKDYDHYRNLVSLRNGEIKEYQMPINTYNLTTSLRKHILDKFDTVIAQWNSLTTLDGNQFIAIQMAALQNGGFSSMALDTMFKGVLDLVQTQTNSNQSKILALQPFFRRTHNILHFHEWAENQKIAYKLGDTPTRDYNQWVTRKINAIIGQ